MSTTHNSLEAQANERKLRLAQLRSLKRKAQTDDAAPVNDNTNNNEATPSDATPEDITTKYLSGRNYDIETRGPKLGFDHAPTEGRVTLEAQAAEVISETAEWKATQEKRDKPIDLFTLQPKKPNWDLKRDLDRKLELLNVRTDNAIARLVRQRVLEQEKAKAKNQTVGAGGVENGDQDVAMDGATLVEGVHLREKEELDEKRRVNEGDDDDDMT